MLPIPGRVPVRLSAHSACVLSKHSPIVASASTGVILHVEVWGLWAVLRSFSPIALKSIPKHDVFSCVSWLLLHHNTRWLETADRPCPSTDWHFSIPGCLSIVLQGTDVVEALFSVGFLFLPMSISLQCPWLVSLEGKWQYIFNYALAVRSSEL